VLARALLALTAAQRTATALAPARMDSLVPRVIARPAPRPAMLQDLSAVTALTLASASRDITAACVRTSNVRRLV